MEAALYAKMLSDQSITDLKKLKYKYPEANLEEFISLLKNGVYKTLPLLDFAGNDLVYMENIAQVRMNAVKLLLKKPQAGQLAFGRKAMEEEIIASLTIENIDFSRDSVRKILQGYAPADESEERIYGMKKGLEFIADESNSISEESIHSLYQLAIEPYLQKEDRLKSTAYYRHDTVFIVGREVEHTGLPPTKLPEYMRRLVLFIQEETSMNDLLKAAIIHFYIGYLHPYFDGNGRMARLIHLWYLRQQSYSSALFIPFSSYIDRTRRGYYRAFSLAETNAEISGTMDVTPFLTYFIESVYNRLEKITPEADTLARFQKAISEGAVTEKEKDLWNFVLSAYGSEEFSTKKLERDFGNVAYGTVRSFVRKFEELELLRGQRYGNKVKYSLR